MTTTLFQYPGGKSHLAPWITENMPDHDVFVEAFGGSGCLILNKEKAKVNVYNDLDSDIVHFFIVYREAPDRLIEYVERIPYSYEVYEDIAESFYNDEFEDPPLTDNLATPEDVTDSHIRRAGVFFALRYMQWGSKYHNKSGFGRSKQLSQADTWSNAKERLRDFIGFYDDITIENVSYEKLIDSYDSASTLWYFDPPYIGTEDYYRESGFDHQKFCKHLGCIEGYWIVSYDEIPDQLAWHYIQRKDSKNYIDSGKSGDAKDTVETLVTNYDPDEVEPWRGGQTGLADWQAASITEPKSPDDGDGGGFLEDAIIEDDEDDDFLSGVLDDDGGADDTGGFLADAI